MSFSSIIDSEYFRIYLTISLLGMFYVKSPFFLFIKTEGDRSRNVKAVSINELAELLPSEIKARSETRRDSRRQSSIRSTQRRRLPCDERTRQRQELDWFKLSAVRSASFGLKCVGRLLCWNKKGEDARTGVASKSERHREQCLSSISFISFIL